MRKTPGRWAVVVLLGVAIVAVPAQAQDGETGRAAVIVAGTCEATQGGEVIAELASVRAPAGEAGDPAEARALRSSFTLVPLSLGTLLAGDHAIVVFGPAGGAESVVACGEIRGRIGAQGALGVELHPIGDSGVSGVALLAASGANLLQVGVSLFVVEPGEEAAPVGEPEYVTDVRRQVRVLVASLRRFDALFDAPQPGEEAWQNDLAAELTLWQLLYEEAQETVPPPALDEFHDRYVAALELLNGAAADVSTAFETGDEALLAEAADKIQRAIAAIQALDSGADGDAAGTPAAND